MGQTGKCPKRTMRAILSFAVVMFIGFITESGYCAGQPDPVALLQGVEAARLQTPPSTLKMEYTYSSQFVNNRREFTVDFDGDKRRFITTSGPDDKAFFDGKQAVIYDGSTKRIEIRNLNEQHLMQFFDPRIMGLVPYYFWHYTVEDAIPYQKATVQMIGEEQINDHKTWHVSLVLKDPNGYRMDFWIDDRFRVYREDENGVQTFSFYENKDYPWLPSRVDGKEYGTNGVVTEERQCVILEAKANVKLPTNVWTIAGLSPPRGATVSDVRIRQRIGYWDGQKIVQTLDAALNPELSRPASPTVRIIVVACLVLTTIGFIFFMLKTRKRAEA